MKRLFFFSEKGLEIRQKRLPQYHPSLIISYMSVAGPLIAMRRRSEAQAAYRNAVQIARHAFTC